MILIVWHKTNVVGTLNMLGLAKRVGARFLLTSTSEVYGDPLQHPQAETYWGNVNPIGNNKVYFIKLFQILALILILIKLCSILFYLDPFWRCIGVRSCYDEGKRVAETLAMDYHRGAGIEVCWFHIMMISYMHAVMFVDGDEFIY